MNRKWFGFATLLVAAVLILNLSSCARSQTLDLITVNPQGSTIQLGGFGEQVSVQFTALGSYSHHPENRDITTKAVWTTDSPDIITVDPAHPGLVTTTGMGCGTNLGVTASVYSNPANPPDGSVVIGRSTISVNFGTGSGCP